MIRVLLTGGTGQLGRAVIDAASRQPMIELTVPTRAELDLTDLAGARRTVIDLAPDVVLNAAAYTKVDHAEQVPELVDLVNHRAVAALAQGADHVGARLVQISTDFVFAGDVERAYTEQDDVDPINVYGKTKALGEDAARRIARHLILRTAWLFSAQGDGFVPTMRRLATDRSIIDVVHDQRGNPTSAADLAGALLRLLSDAGVRDLTGTYHLAAPDAASRHQLAVAVLADEIAAGSVEVRPVSSSTMATAALRPADSSLDSTAIGRAAGITLRPWQEALAETLGRGVLHDTVAGDGDRRAGR